jgi:hypothetical protein
MLATRRFVIIFFVGMISAALFPHRIEARISCPRLINWVCALNSSTQLETFQNSCEAIKAKAVVLHQGQCFPTFCSHLCIEHGIVGRGALSGKVKLYDNLCWAEKDFAIFVKLGPCPRP